MSKAGPTIAPALQAVLLAAAPVMSVGSPWSILWTGPGILMSSMMIAWGAECPQFFVAQGLALAILAWLQTLPEFAVEAVLGYHQQAQYLLASLTGALRLLTGLGWPMIYASAAIAYRAEHKRGMGKITLPEHQAIQVVGLCSLPGLCCGDRVQSISHGLR